MVLLIYVILCQILLDGFTSIAVHFPYFCLGGSSNLHFCYFISDSAL